jgi:hypothetical protein
MLNIGMPLGGEVRVLTATNPSCLIQRGLAHGSDCPKNAWRMVVRGRNAFQHVPCYSL